MVTQPELCLSHGEAAKGLGQGPQGRAEPAHAILFVPLYNEEDRRQVVGVLQLVQQENDIDFDSSLSVMQSCLQARAPSVPDLSGQADDRVCL
jgi:hypothetical protein